MSQCEGKVRKRNKSFFSIDGSVFNDVLKIQFLNRKKLHCESRCLVKKI